MKQNINYRILLIVCSLLTILAIPVAAQEGIHKDKTSIYNYETHIGEITLENFVEGEVKVIQEAKAIEAILVMDFSSSMNDSYSGGGSSYTRVVPSKFYNGNNLYYGVDGSSKTLLNKVAESKTAQKDVAVYTGSSKTAEKLTVNYKGQSYAVFAIVLVDSGGYIETWIYIKVDGKRVFVRPDGSFMEESGTATDIQYYKNWPVGVDGFKITPVRKSDTPILILMEEKTAKIDRRIEALRDAAGRFVDIIADHAKQNGTADRIATVIFDANNDTYFPKVYGENSTSPVSDYLNPEKKTYLMEVPTDMKSTTSRDNDLEGKSFVGKRFVDLNSQDAAKLLKFSFSNDTVKGSTPVHVGMQIAAELMKASGRTATNVERFIIVLTDGEPTQAAGTSTSNWDVATDAVKVAYGLKNSTTVKSTIYTIYCNSSSPSDKVQKFLNHLSSNYPSAQSYDDNTTKSDDKYFKTATTNLSTIFEGIAKEISEGASAKVGVKTEMRDFVNKTYFKLPIGADESSVKVYKVPLKTYDGTKTPKEFGFETLKEEYRLTSDDITVQVTKSTTDGNDEVMVKGFDYSSDDNWCGKRSDGTVKGNKLVIKFPFVFKDGLEEMTGQLQTNTSESGLYIPDEDGNLPDKPSTKYEIPKIVLCSITIKRTNLAAGESATYEITKSGDSSFRREITLTGKTGVSEVSKTILSLDAGTYTVIETNWDFTYDDPNKTKSHTFADTADGTDASVTLTFEGTKKTEEDGKKHSEAGVDNVMSLPGRATKTK